MSIISLTRSQHDQFGNSPAQWCAYLTRKRRHGAIVDRRATIHGWTIVVSPVTGAFTGGLADGGGA
jgi:hypothetical protein